MVSRFFLPTGLLHLLLVSSALNGARVAAGPAVNVALQASFNSPPYLLELLLVTTRHSISVKHGAEIRIAKPQRKKTRPLISHSLTG